MSQTDWVWKIIRFVNFDLDSDADLMSVNGYELGTNSARNHAYLKMSPRKDCLALKIVYENKLFNYDEESALQWFFVKVQIK